jgi:hypothetical protein
LSSSYTALGNECMLFVHELLHDVVPDDESTTKKGFAIEVHVNGELLLKQE